MKRLSPMVRVKPAFSSNESRFRSIISDDMDMIEKVFTEINSEYSEAFKRLEPYLGKINVPLTTISLLLLEATSKGMLPLEESEPLDLILKELIEEVDSDLSEHTKRMTGGGRSRMIIRLLLIIAIASMLGVRLRNDFVTRVGDHINSFYTGGCNTELSIAYSAIIEMLKQNTPEAVTQLYESIPVPQVVNDVTMQGVGYLKEQLPPLHLFPYSFRDYTWNDLYELAGLAPQKLGETMGVVKSCTDRMLIIREVVGNYSMIWTLYSSASFVFYGFFFDGENKRNRSNFTEMLVQVWRPLLGVGNPIIGTARGAVYALETLLDGFLGTCAFVNKVIRPAPPRKSFGQAQTFGQSFGQPQTFGKLRGGRFRNTRRNKIKKQKMLTYRK